MSKDKFATAEEEEETSKKSQKGKAIGGILGMLPTIAGAIPGLMKSKQTGALERMQQGRGAGATAARQAASEAGRRTAGNLGGRGSQGLVRAGIRSAEEQTAEGARAAGMIGAQEGIVGTQMLLNEEQRRRGLGLQLGAAVGGATAAGLANALAAEDQGPAGPEVAQALTRPADLAAPGGVDLGQPQLGAQPQSTAGPSLAPPPGTLTFDQGLESVAGQTVSPFGVTGQPDPNVQLQEPGQDFNLNQDGFALGAILSPDQKFEEAKKAYVAHTTKPSERPFEPSTGGTEFSARQRAVMMAFQRDVQMRLENKQITPEDAAIMIQDMQAEVRGGF